MGPLAGVTLLTTTFFTWNADGAVAVVEPTLTLKDAVDAPEGTLATICVSLQLDGVIATLLYMTVLEPWVAPNPFPVRVTEVPAGPAGGEKELT
jgi:hypothetical protein